MLALDAVDTHVYCLNFSVVLTAVLLLLQHQQQ
jgi:hypothetical protein